MRHFSFTVVLLSLLSVLGAVGAWPDFHNHPELIVGTLGFLGCATFFGLNLLRSVREYEEEVPAIGSDEEVFEDFWGSALPPLPTSTTTTDSTPTIAQTDLLPSPTQEAPRSFYTIFEFDPPETVTLFSGSPPVPKVVVAEVYDNSTIIGTEIIVRLADVEENFQNFTFIAPTPSPVTAPTTYPDATWGVNTPTPDSTHLNTTSSKWALPTFFIHILQDSRLKPFVESARRKLNFFWGLRNTLFGPFIRLLPVRPQTLGFVLVSVKLLNLWLPGMARRRRRLTDRYAPRFAAILQRLGWFDASEQTPQLAIGAGSGAGPQMEHSTGEVEAIVQTLVLCISIIERQLVDMGYQEESQVDNRDFVNAVEEQVPVVEQASVPAGLSGFIMRPLPPPSRLRTAAASTDISPGASTPVERTTLEPSSQPSSQPPKLPAFASTHSTAPIADHIRRRRLPIILYKDMKRRPLISPTDQGENGDVLPSQADPKKSLRDISGAASADPSASASASVSAKNSSAINDTVLVPVSASVGVAPCSADQQPAAQPDLKAANLSTGSDMQPQLKETDIKKAKARSTTGSEFGPQLEEDSPRYRVEFLARRFQENYGVKDADPAQLHRFLDFFGLWDAVNQVHAKDLYQQWLHFQAHEEKTSEETRQAAAIAPKVVSIEAESSSVVKNLGTSTDSAQPADATAAPQSTDVVPALPPKINSAQRSLLRDTVRHRLKKDFGVNDVDSKSVEQFFDIYGWHKLSLESLSEVCTAWLVWEAEETAKAAVVTSNRQPHAPAATSGGEQTVASAAEPASTEVVSKSASSETVDDEEDGTNADGKRKLRKAEEDLPPISHVKDDSDDDDDDDQHGPPPPPSSGAVVARTSSVETRPAEERNNATPVSGGDNGSSNNQASTHPAAPAPVTAASPWPVFNGFQFNVQTRLPERPVYQVSDEDKIFNIITDTVGASTHRRSALRNQGQDPDEVQPRFKHGSRARIAENFDGSPITETRHFRAQEPPARIQRAAEMDIDAEGQEATGAPAPAPAQQASVQSFPAVPEFSAEMEGVESDTVCPAHPEVQQQQSAMSFRQPVQVGSPYNVVPPFSEPLVQDQQETMVEEQTPSNAALFDVTPPNQVASDQAQLGQYYPHGYTTLGTTEWNNPEAIDEQDRQRQQQPQQQPIVLQGQDWSDPDDFFNSIGLSPNATGPGLNVDMAGEMPEIQALLDSLLPTSRTEYDPNQPQARMEEFEMNTRAEGARSSQDAPQAAPIPMQPAAGDLPHGDPSEWAGLPNASDFVGEPSGMTTEAPASATQPVMSPWDHAKLRAAIQSIQSGSSQNNADQLLGSHYSYEEPIIDDRTDEQREWGVPSKNRISKQYEGHVQRKKLRPRSRLMVQQANPAQTNPFSNLLRPQSNTAVNLEDIQIPAGLAAALQLRHNQNLRAGISQPDQQPTHPHESHASGELSPAPGHGDDDSSPNFIQDEKNADDDNVTDVPDLNEEERGQIRAHLQGQSPISSEAPQSPATHSSHRHNISFEDSVENYLYDSP
ncbi:hypothetical protein PV04_03431 [Phialophora macrospora]|uniref:PXA domain-containing protein n=1 Tax=Phialophora macrospora TaxID=1851006 RepID=A0A0D2FXQ4_9EURO|nr:hypothetical protein PV04_03431 [Phialophora macrospora]